MNSNYPQNPEQFSQPKKSRPVRYKVFAGLGVVAGRSSSMGIVGAATGSGSKTAATATAATATPAAVPVTVTDPSGMACAALDSNGYCPPVAPAATPAATTPAAPPKPVYHKLTARKWAQIVKDPDAYQGKTYVIYGEVTQFDANTGPTESARTWAPPASTPTRSASSTTR